MSTATKSLLIELGTEELPPKALDELAAALAKEVTGELHSSGVDADWTQIKVYCSPRRLAMFLPQVTAEQPSKLQERRGPALNAGLDANGQPTKALLGFAQSCGVEVAQLEKLETDKGSWFVHRALKKGRPTVALIPEIVAGALKALPIPKPMRWGDHDYAFVRPAHWLVMLYGADVIEGEILGLKSGRESRGHRFHHPQPVQIADADSWLDAMRLAKVLADPIERRKRIGFELQTQSGRIRSATKRDDISVYVPAELVDEVANLTEWPVAICCSFDSEFLVIPHEALSQTMRNNQKFFPVIDRQHRLTEHFVGIANIESKDPAEIRRGYERVIRPRFADAKFFYDEDLKTPLAAQQEALKSVTYQQSLGSVWDKCVRVAELSRVIANRVGADAGLATRAAALSKCDLLTRMVGEFPELQGVMGRYYATANGENAEIAQALDEFYKPRFAGDGVATGTIGKVLAVAERLDTLAGIFAVGQKPSGNKDPFALRRAALGLARTLIEGDLEIDLKAMLIEALQLLPDAALAAGLPKGKDGKAPALDAGARRDALAKELYDFILDRLRSYYTDQGTASGEFEAVRVLAVSDLTDFHARLRAVVAFAQLPQASSLAAANKRIGNILRQAGGDVGTAIDPALLDAGAEAELYAAVEATAKTIAPLAAQRRYIDTLRELAGLREPVDKFFEGVMVMVDDAAKRNNRLALLNRLRRMFLDVADISLLPGT